MKIAFYGSSLLSSYWNGAATYYRGLLSDLARRGYEHHLLRARRLRPPEAPRHRSAGLGRRRASIRRPRKRCASVDRRGGARPTSWSRRAASACSTTCCSTASSPPSRPEAIRIFWDVDAPATLAELRRRPGPSAAPRDAVARPRLHLWRRAAGRRRPTRASAPGAACRSTTRSIPTTHHPGAAGAALRGRPRLPRQPAARPRGARRAFFLDPAARLPDRRFLHRRQRLGRQGDAAERAPHRPRLHARAQRLQHHARSPCSTSRATAWPTIGFSPATRVFEAAGAGACLITDAWEGIELFLEPDEEVLVARDGADVAEHLAGADAGARARRSARRRARASWPSTPTRGAAREVDAHPDARRRPRSGRGASRERALDRRSRAQPVLVLGQRPCDHLPRAAQGLRRARPRHPVPRARRALVRRAPRPRRSGLLPARASTTICAELARYAERRSQAPTR